MKMKNITSLVMGLAFVAVNATYGQVGSINSVAIVPEQFQPPIPGTTFTGTASGNPQNDTLNVSLSEANVSNPGGNGYANRDAWYFSADGGATPYQFQNGDHFDATFTLNLTGGTPGSDLEGGFLFSNPNGGLGYGGDSQIVAVGQGGNAGVVFQGGATSFNLFAPNGTYAIGTSITMGLNYVFDPNTGYNALQYSVNGVFADSAPSDTYFDIIPGGNSPGSGPGSGPFASGSDTLGGYFQIQTDPNNPGNSGEAAFSKISIAAVPDETSTLALLSVGILALSPRLLRRRCV
jgi:hypothetical protein